MHTVHWILIEGGTPPWPLLPKNDCIVSCAQSVTDCSSDATNCIHKLHTLVPRQSTAEASLPKFAHPACGARYVAFYFQQNPSKLRPTSLYVTDACRPN
jgi:hypothetical protein